MTFDLQRILESKRAYRRELASLPVAQKLALLDALRERALALREAGRRRQVVPFPEAPARDKRN
jgi:hypothetical protein